MFRRQWMALAVNIPRSVWDPAHHNPNWADSYSIDIADRRHWPAKKWSIGLEPRTPREWLQFSYRNLAYAYNGALRACRSFPEMLVYYKEMKQRGVKVDVDTLNVLLTRAARYEHIQTNDIFELFEEMVSLGARPDLASVEILHTVLEHSASQSFEWREARRRQLAELYNHLAMEEIERLAPHRADALLAQQMQRIRENLRSLQAVLSPSVYRRFFSVLHSGELLLQEVHNYLWARVSNDHPAIDLPSLQMRIPYIASALRRPSTDATEAVQRSMFEDVDVCSVFLAAFERCVDDDFRDSRTYNDRRMYLSLLAMLSSSGVLYTADLMAQLMDIVKYSRNDTSRDADAQRLLRFALRGSSSAQDESDRSVWKQVEKAADARVVGRYISCRDPWSRTRICVDETGRFGLFAPPQRTLSHTASHATAASGDGAGSTPGETSSAQEQKPQTPEAPTDGVSDAAAIADDEQAAESIRGGATSDARTAEALHLRWNDVRQLIEQTGALAAARGGTHCSPQEQMEVFTGQMVFLRTAATGQRYGDLASAYTTQAVGEDGGTNHGAMFHGLGFDGYEYLLQCVKEVHHSMEKFIEQHRVEGSVVEPEFECWEAMLIVLRCILDFCVLHGQQAGKTTGASDGAAALFRDAAEFRTRLVEESRTRFGGRLRILWLQEV